MYYKTDYACLANKTDTHGDHAENGISYTILPLYACLLLHRDSVVVTIYYAIMHA
jgi:hypothetical protein